MQRLLEAVEFRNPSRAREDIARLGGGIPERIRGADSVAAGGGARSRRGAALPGAAAPGVPGGLQPHHQFSGRAALPDHHILIQQIPFRSRAAASRMAVAGGRYGRSAPHAVGRGIRGALAAIPCRRGTRSAVAGDPGALPAAAIAAHPAARCAGAGGAGGHHRRAVQPGRRDPGLRLSPGARTTDGAAWRAVVRVAGRPTARLRFCRDRAGQAGRPGVELQFGRRPDVRVFGQRRRRPDPA